MDVFIEHIVRHKLEMKDILVIFAVILLAVAITVFGGGLFLHPATRFLAILLLVGVWYGAMWLVKSRYIEYEYIVTNSSIDIDKIMGKSRRKRVISIECKEVEICACIDDAMHNSEYKVTDGINKVLDCTGYGAGDVYFLDIVSEKGKTRVLFEPTTKMIESVQKFNPRKIFVKN